MKGFFFLYPGRLMSVLIFAFTLSQGLVLSGQLNFTSNLPILVINTNGQEILDEPKITARLGIIHNANGQNRPTDAFNGYDGLIGIEIRGSSSQMFPKKGYGFETRKADGSNNNVALLGMPAENDWILHGPYNDKTLIRNMLCYTLASGIMDYAPRGRYCELIINGDYRGVYVLMEKIKRDKNRVAVAEISNTDNSGDRLTGGYILKIDKTSGSNNDGWTSAFKPIPGRDQTTYFQYHYPDPKTITAAQKTYIQQFIRTVEESIASPVYNNPVTGYRRHVDTESLLDYIIMNEISKNPDAYRLSTFMYKDRDSRGGKLRFGPVWDYDLGFGNVNYCTNWNPEGLVINEFNQVCSFDYWVIHFWWGKFMKDIHLKSDLKKRWQQLRQNQLSDSRIEFVVDSLSQLLTGAQERNFQRWPVLNEYVWPNAYIGGSYTNEILWLKNWLKDRLRWLDIEFDAYITVQTAEAETRPEIMISPNPVKDELQIRLNYAPQMDSKIILRNTSGSQIYRFLLKNPSENSFTLPVENLQPGLYLINILNGDQSCYGRFIKI